MMLQFLWTEAGRDVNHSSQRQRRAQAHVERGDEGCWHGRASAQQYAKRNHEYHDEIGFQGHDIPQLTLLKLYLPNALHVLKEHPDEHP